MTRIPRVTAASIALHAFLLGLCAHLGHPAPARASLDTRVCTAAFDGHQFAGLQAHVSAVDASARGRVSYPSAWDVDANRAAAASWKGTPGAPLFRDCLPPNAAWIDHPLKGAGEPGVVKTGTPGEAAFARIETEFGGRSIGTNVVFPKQVLMDNLLREKKTLVPETAKAVVIWLHGGGTDTTGVHVAVNPLNVLWNGFGVSVLGIELPQHGETSPEDFRNVRHMLLWLRKVIREQVAPAGVPIVLAGHSMGGIIADLYRQMFPDDDLVQAIASMSSIPDTAPGAPLEAKLVEAAKRERGEITNPDVSPGDAALGDNLLSSGKLAPRGILIERMLTSELDWKRDWDGGRRKPLPALYIWGQRDWLYLKDAVDQGLRGQPDTRIETYPGIGHLIFDHQKPGAKDSTPEAFVDLLDFMEQTLGRPFKRITGEETQKANSTAPKGAGVFGKLAQNYANNLAFREFARTYKILDRVAVSKERMVEIGRWIDELAAALGRGKHAKKAKAAAAQAQPAPGGTPSARPRELKHPETGAPITPEEGNALFDQLVAQRDAEGGFVPTELFPTEKKISRAIRLLGEALGRKDPRAEEASATASAEAKAPAEIRNPETGEILTVEQATALYDRLFASRGGTYVPDGPEHDRVLRDRARYDELGEEIKGTLEAFRAANAQLIDAQARQAQLAGEIRAAAEGSQEPMIVAFLEYLDSRKKRIAGILSRIDDRMNREMLERYRADGTLGSDAELPWGPPPSAELKALFAEYGREMANYLEASSQLTSVALSNGLPRFKKRRKDLQREIQSIQERLTALETRYLDARAEMNRLQSYLVPVQSDGLFEMRYTTLASILALPSSQWDQHIRALEETQKDWMMLWRERPPAEKASLY